MLKKILIPFLLPKQPINTFYFTKTKESLLKESDTTAKLLPIVLDEWTKINPDTPDDSKSIRERITYVLYSPA